jgi:transcriptional regulator with XRE-family HTH domain
MIDTTAAKRIFGSLLKQIRNNSNLSLRQLGVKSNLPHSLIAGIESGDRPAGLSVAVKLQKALELTSPDADVFLLKAAQTTHRDHLLQEVHGLDALTINFLPRFIIKNGLVPATIKNTEIFTVRENDAYAAREQLNIELTDGRKVSCHITITNN